MGNGQRWTWDPEVVFEHYRPYDGVDEATIETRIHAALEKAARVAEPMAALPGESMLATVREALEEVLTQLFLERMLVPLPSSRHADVASAAVDWACPVSRYCRGKDFNENGTCRHHTLPGAGEGERHG